MMGRGCEFTMNANERFHNAAGLVQDGQYADATKELVWLWDHMVQEDRALSGVRSSYLVGWMKRLADLDEDARHEFVKIRDGLTPELEKDDPDIYLVKDWFTLSRDLLEDDDSIKAWIDGLLSMDADPLVLKALRKPIHMWLCKHGRWTDAGKLLEPGSLLVARVRLQVEVEKHRTQFSEETRLTLTEIHLRDLVLAHASYLAAGRDEEAWAIVETTLELFDKEQACVAICEIAKEAGVLSQRHASLGQKPGESESND